MENIVLELVVRHLVWYNLVDRHVTLECLYIAHLVGLMGLC